MEIRSAVTGKIRNLIRPTPLKVGLGASVAVHTGLLAAQLPQTLELVANYPCTIAFTTAATLIFSGKMIYNVIRKGAPLDPAKLMSWSERVRAENFELKRVATSALAEFATIGKSNINWGKLKTKGF